MSAAIAWPVRISKQEEWAKRAYYGHAAEMDENRAWEHLSNRERVAWQAAASAILDADLECECGQYLLCPDCDAESVEPYCPVCGEPCEECVRREAATDASCAGDIPLLPPLAKGGD